MAERLPLDDRLATAGQLVVRARLFYEIWWFYDGAETRPQIIGTMRRFSEFFRLDPHAHFVSLIMHAAALLEWRSNTINLPSLVEEVALTKHSSQDVISECRALLKELDYYRPKVIILRSNLFAHRSAALSYARAFELAKIKPDELGTACEFLLRVINRLLAMRGLQEQYFHPLPRQHLEQLLRTLETAI